jgi:hypothetical protein
MWALLGGRCVTSAAALLPCQLRMVSVERRPGSMREKGAFCRALQIVLRRHPGGDGTLLRACWSGSGYE